jgi:hypothetical protein
MNTLETHCFAYTICLIVENECAAFVATTKIHFAHLRYSITLLHDIHKYIHQSGCKRVSSQEFRKGNGTGIR